MEVVSNKYVVIVKNNTCNSDVAVAVVVVVVVVVVEWSFAAVKRARFLRLLFESFYSKETSF
jgi:hypothetical protein